MNTDKVLGVAVIVMLGVLVFSIYMLQKASSARVTAQKAFCSGLCEKDQLACYKHFSEYR